MTKADARRLVEAMSDEMSLEQQQTLVQSLLARGSADALEDVMRVPDPDVGEVPAHVRGFRVRLDLVGAQPPVWRRLELPGDLTLDQGHAVLQAAMGWGDVHLHRFRTGADYRSPHFVTRLDLEEGETGVLETEVRLDQVLVAKGDRLWYEYDFGDGWEHVITVETVLDELPPEPRCTDGRMACPPEDCGGVGGYEELASWVRARGPAGSLPAPFEHADEVRDWLPTEWHPDRFDVEEVNADLTRLRDAMIPVPPELAELRARSELFGDGRLTEMVVRTAASPAPEMDEGDAARLIEPFTTLLDVIGDGVQLTGAGYLKPALVEQLADRLGVTEWWIGKVNREDQTAPVARLRESARALGLVNVRKGRLLPTAIGRRHREQPVKLWRHVVSRLPLGRTDFQRDAGWVALTVAASGLPTEEWTREMRSVLGSLGWRVPGYSADVLPVGNPTLTVLELLSGSTRQHLPSGTDPAVAATTRTVVLA